MKALLLFALALVAESVQHGLLGHLAVAPDFLLGMVVLIALDRRPPAGAAAGLALGLLRDILAGGPLGAETLPLTLVGWAVGSAGRTLYRDSIFTRALMMLGGGILHGAAVYLILTGGEVEGLFGYLRRQALPTAIATAVVVPALVALFHPDRLRRLLPRRRRRRPHHHEAPILSDQS